MRTNFLSIFLLLIFGVGFAQDKSFDLLENDTQTYILYDRVFGISNATQQKTEAISNTYFMQVYHEIQRADFLQRLPKLDYLRGQADQGFIQNTIPLAVLISDFEQIEATAFEAGVVSKNQDGNFVLNTTNDDVFNAHQVNLMGALSARSKQQNTNFILKEDLIFNTSQRTIASVEIQNQGSWNTINTDQVFQLNLNSGNQNIPYKINFTDGTTLTQSFKIQGNFNPTNYGTDGINEALNITATIGYQGFDETEAYFGEGEYEVFLDTVDGVLDRPIFLIDGFDPGDSRGISGIYEMLNYGEGYGNLGDMLREEGYDIVVLNFPIYTRTGTSTIIDGGVDYIQRNAMILVELINQINSEKVGDKKNIVIGPSMGGLISRYALRYMEQNDMEHDTRLYISFDSPHLGANVPIGFQHMFNYMAFGPFEEVTLQEVVNGMLKSPAAKQMLVDHFESHLENGSVTEFDDNLTLPMGAANFRDAFQNELDTMGFPEETRNVSIINGAGNGVSNGTPGMVVMDHIFNLSSTQRAIINLNYTPAAGQTAEMSHFEGQQWILFWVTFYESYANAQSPSYTNGIDTSPGGRFDLNAFADMAEGNDMLDEFFDNLQADYFSFIPSVSALAVTETQNLYAPLTSGLNTPFDAFYMPLENENHVTLQSENVEFALNEILIDEAEDCLAAPNGQYPSELYYPQCWGTPEIITMFAKTGQYSEVILTEGIEYTFSSSVETDYIIISDEEGTEIYAEGYSSLVWTATADEVIRFYLLLDDECNYDFEERERLIQCGEELGIQDELAEFIKIENPVKNNLIIQTNKMLQDAQIDIKDMNGRTVFNKTKVSGFGSLNFPINLEKGVYILTIQNQGQVYRQKLIKK